MAGRSEPPIRLVGVRARHGLHRKAQCRACRYCDLRQCLSAGVDARRGLRHACAVLCLAQSVSLDEPVVRGPGGVRGARRPAAGRDGVLRSPGAAQGTRPVRRRDRSAGASGAGAGTGDLSWRSGGTHRRSGAGLGPLAGLARQGGNRHRSRIPGGGRLPFASGAAGRHSFPARELLDRGHGVSPGGHPVRCGGDRRHAGARRVRGPPSRPRRTRPHRSRRANRGTCGRTAARGAASVELRPRAGGLGALARPDDALRGGSRAICTQSACRGRGSASGHGLHRPLRAAGAGALGGRQHARPGLPGGGCGADR